MQSRLDGFGVLGGPGFAAAMGACAFAAMNIAGAFDLALCLGGGRKILAEFYSSSSE